MLRLWDVASGARLHEYPTSTWYGHDIVPGWPLSFSGDGTRLTFPNDGNAGATVFTPQRWIVERFLSGRHTRPVEDVAFSTDGRLVATGSADRTARIFDVATGKELHVLNEHTMPVRSVAFSPTAPHLATGSSDRSIRIWDVETGTQLQVLRGTHRGEVCDLTYSPDGRHIASGGADGVVKIWDAP
jgi:WD40 repeat protein